VSSDEQARKGYSIPEQRHTLIEYAKTKGYTIVDVYADEGASASKKPHRRHEFQRMLKDCEAGLVDVIVFLKLDRWFRSVKDYYATQAMLEQYNVAWECVLEDYDVTTRSGRLNLNIRLSIAEDEAAAAGERVLFVFDGKIRRKEAVTGIQPWGYTIKDKMVVFDPETEHMVRDMFDKYFSCLSGYETHSYMVDKYGITCDYNTTRRRLRHSAYTGEYKGIPDYRPAYITQEQHLFILKQFSQHYRDTGNRRTYLFSGLFRCPACGRTLVSCTSNKKHQGYRCSNRGCSFKHTVYEDYIETILLNDIDHYVHSLKVKAGIKNKKTAEIDPTVYENRLKRLNDIYLMGNIGEEDYRIKSAELKSKIAEIKAPKTPKSIIAPELKEVLSGGRFDTIYATLDAKERRTLWHSIVESVVVNEDGRIEDILYLT
jgi:DNA invertase Pin-like site-specific DNA recombinase